MKRTGEKSPNRLLQFDQDFLTRGFKTLAGVDEAGRGPWAGPVVASAVIVRDRSFENPVDDSKKMKPEARERAYGEILAKCVVGVGVIEAPEIDRINILQATFLAMEAALEGLGVKPDCILVDGDKVPKVPDQTFPVIDGDGLSFSIACASVVAKVTRDRIMEYYDGIYPLYGFARHKGYGTPVHAEALKKHGPCRIHRQSFEPVRQTAREDGNTFNNRLRFAV